VLHFQKIIKNKKKQNFESLTKNPVTTFLLSKRKHSWLFFEIGIENGFLATKNGFFGYQKWKKVNFLENHQKLIENSKMYNIWPKITRSTFLMSTKKHSWVFFEIGIENGFLATKNEKKLNFRNFFRKSSKTQRMFIVFVDNGLTKWRGRLKFCMRLRNRYKYHVLAAHTSSQKSTVFFLTFSLDFQKFFRKSSKTHRKQQNIQCLT